jgi:hypothetical protein
LAVCTEILGHRRARQPHHVGERDSSEYECRQQQVGEAGVASHCRWHPTPLDTDEELREKADDEDRHGDDDEADDEDRRVEQLALAQTRDETEADTEHGLDHEGHRGELGRDRKRLYENFTDRAAREGHAEVERENALEVQQVLHDERLVEVIAGAQLVGDGGTDRLVSGQCRDGVSWQQEDHGIDQECRPDEHGDHLK